MHSHAYASALNSLEEASLAGVWDDDPARGREFAKTYGADFFDNIDALLDKCDAAVVTSENKRHADLVDKAARAGRHILCEKPVVTSEDEADRMLDDVSEAGIIFMTAFPCRFSPAYERLRERVRNGDVGKVLAICATNHGMCPFGWFVESEESGGGAMMDHTVHVADLLRDLLQESPTEVYAQTGNNIYAEQWDDTAMMHLKFASGVFATIDASWSRPKTYKTWGDVRMNVVGEKGVIELDMFGQAFDWYKDSHRAAFFGSDIDARMIKAFLQSIETGEAPPVTLNDGIEAARIAIRGYESAARSQPVALGN